MNDDRKATFSNICRTLFSFVFNTISIQNYPCLVSKKLKEYNINDSDSNDLFLTAVPIGVATNVYAWPFNSTAIQVSWKVIPNDRINMRGTLLGYQVILTVFFFLSLYLLHIFANLSFPGIFSATLFLFCFFPYLCNISLSHAYIYI